MLFGRSAIKPSLDGRRNGSVDIQVRCHDSVLLLLREQERPECPTLPPMEQVDVVARSALLAEPQHGAPSSLFAAAFLAIARALHRRRMLQPTQPERVLRLASRLAGSGLHTWRSRLLSQEAHQ